MLVQSKTPLWQTADLRLTRVKDDLRGEVLIFKEAEWQTLRIEANALDTGDPTLATTPLRLIANQSKTRITIKKKLAGEKQDLNLSSKQGLYRHRIELDWTSVFGGGSLSVYTVRVSQNNECNCKCTRQDLHSAENVSGKGKHQ